MNASTVSDMNDSAVSDLFAVRSHNPSFFSVRDRLAVSSAAEGVTGPELLDFCIPVNLHFPPPAMLEEVRDGLGDVLRYYPDYAEAHQRYIGEIAGLDHETVVPCNGSTEAITLLCQRASGSIATPVPTFSRWTDLPLELGVPLHTVQRERSRDFRLGVDDLVGAVRGSGARTLVVCNPSNPTGVWLTLAEVEALAAELDDLDAVVIDESFIDFSDIGSAGPLVTAYPNLVVVKSLGKSMGWHGVRLGYAVACPERAAALRARLPFWNVNGLAAHVLRTATGYLPEYRASFVRVAEDRTYMETALSAVPGLTVFRSKANFMFVELPEGVSGKALRDRLVVKHRVMVRECSNKIGSSERYLRLAVQQREAVDRLVSALQEELTVPASRLAA